MNTSIKMDTPCEVINVTPLNPMISKCQIKVCYVGEQPNRNKSIITKEVAVQMANTLPGSPIVGYYNDSTKDFEEHNRKIEIKNGHLNFKDDTTPYGFVDLNAKVWFQDYIDGNEIHTYLVTEGYLWTGQYPEAKRIIDKGNNQSMHLDPATLDGTWTYDDKSGTRFFIINDAIFSNLCILGDDYEPCFEGANITSFSLDDEFNNKIYSLMKEVQKLKGGNLTVGDNIKKPEEGVVVDPVVEEKTDPAQTEKPAAELEQDPKGASAEEGAPAAEENPAEEPAAEGKEAAQEGEPAEDPVEEPAEENQEKEEGEVAQFSLTDFQNLQERYSNLETQFNELQTSFNEMKASYDELVEFKNTKDREQKQAMIDSFYMLDDSDKKDVVENIDKYSLDEIEAKLSIICVHNKLDLSGTNDKNKPETTFSLEDVEDDSESSIPALVSVLRKNRKNEN